jgi:hypothetical protein
MRAFSNELLDAVTLGKIPNDRSGIENASRKERFFSEKRTFTCAEQRHSHAQLNVH